MSNGNVVGWFEIYVSDMPRAMKFYETVFQFGEFTDFSFDGEQLMGFPSVEGAAHDAGALVESGGWTPGKGGTTVYFNSDDCAVEENRALAAGGKVYRPKHAVGEHGFVCILEDTEGNMIGIHSSQ